MSRQLSLRTQGELDRELLQGYVSALQTVRSIRTPMFLLLILTLLFPLCACVGVWMGWIQPPDSGSMPGAEAENLRVGLYSVAATGMSLCAFIARLMALLLVLAYLMSFNICLVGHLSGLRHAIGAFFWMALLVLLVVPWHHWLGATAVPMMFYDLDGLITADAEIRHALSGNPMAWDEWLLWGQHYAQYLLFPFIGLLTAGVADIRIGACYRRSLWQIRQQLEISAG